MTITIYHYIKLCLNPIRQYILFYPIFYFNQPPTIYHSTSINPKHGVNFFLDRM
jgi:hypothetical protein